MGYRRVWPTGACVCACQRLHTLRILSEDSERKGDALLPTAFRAGGRKTGREKGCQGRAQRGGVLTLLS